MKIRITECPFQYFPENVQRAFIGLELNGAPIEFRKQCGCEYTQTHEFTTGYAVTIQEILIRLEAVNPMTAQWLETDRIDAMPDFAYAIPASCCEVIEL